MSSSTGIFKYHPKTQDVEKINDSKNLLDQPFNAVVEDSLGTIWLSSFDGIYRYIPKFDEVFHYTRSDGLFSMNYPEYSVVHSKDGNIYFFGERGVSYINPKEVSVNPTLPNVILTDYFLNGQLQNPKGLRNEAAKHILKHSENSLEFNFSILEFSDPAQNKLQYHLLKNNQDTVITGSDNPVRFNLLPPGTYQLDVYASNSDDVWTPKPKSYFFTILPPWYQTWWALLLGLLLLLGIGYAFYRNRIAQIKKREAFRRKEAEFRQKEAEYKQLTAETETAVLRLQMNPHFIFNSMNSISSYILQKDIDTANDFLHRFSRLMRMILERSEQPFTDIYEEVEFLKLYLETEAMRLGKQLNYDIKIDSSEDPDELLLPTMLLQPFIENAIWHGISPKEGPGLIRIQFSVENDRLLCAVEDNGVGRSYQKGAEGGTHESKALDITKRRLALLSKEQHAKAEYQIIDLKDSHGNPTGTKVQIFLPLID